MTCKSCGNAVPLTPPKAKIKDIIEIVIDTRPNATFPKGDRLQVYEVSHPFYWAKSLKTGEKGLFYAYEFDRVADPSR